MRQQLERGLAVADEIVIDKIHRPHDAAFQELIELRGDLLRALEPGIAAVEAGNIAELALIGTAARILDAAQEVMLDIGEFIGRDRKAGHLDAIDRRQHLLLLGTGRIARQARDQFVGRVAQFADVEIVERGIVIRTGADRRPPDRDRQIEGVGATADIVHLLALDVHPADQHSFRPLEVFLAWRGGYSRR